MLKYNYNPKTCRICGNEFKPVSGVQTVCFETDCKYQRKLEKWRKKNEKHRDRINESNRKRYYKRKGLYLPAKIRFSNKNQELIKNCKETKECDCKCGAIIPKYKANGKIRRFLNGHYTRTINYTPEMRLIFRNRWVDSNVSPFHAFINRVERTQKMNQRLQEESVQMKRIGSLITKPNKIELILMNIITTNNIYLEYVGNGKIIIDKMNPDFINREQKKIVEVFGDYWHSGKSGMKCIPEELKRTRYKRLGYELLIIWESEILEMNIENIVKKLNDFLSLEVIVS